MKKAILIMTMLMIAAGAFAETIFDTKSETDPFTDETVARVGVMNTDDNTFMFVKVTDITEIFFTKSYTYIGDKNLRIDYRFDSDDPGSVRVTPSTDGGAVFLKSQDIEWFIANLKKSSRLIVRAYDYQESPIDFIFEIDGIADELAKIGL